MVIQLDEEEMPKGEVIGSYGLLIRLVQSEKGPQINIQTKHEKIPIETVIAQMEVHLRLLKENFYQAYVNNLKVFK